MWNLKFVQGQKYQVLSCLTSPVLTVHNVLFEKCSHKLRCPQRTYEYI